MALDIFSIPAMSADPVWLFSSSKTVLKHTPNQLKSHTREVLEPLSHGWRKEFSYPTSTDSTPFLKMTLWLIIGLRRTFDIVDS